MRKMDIEDFWNMLLKELKEEKEIENWSVDGKTRTKSFKFCVEDEDTIGVMGRKLKIRKKDVKYMYGKWNSYITGRLKRKKLSEKTMVSSHTIALIHHFLKNESL